MKHVIKMWKQSYYGRQLHRMSNDQGTVWKLLVLEWEAEPREQEPKEQNWKKRVEADGENYSFLRKVKTKNKMLAHQTEVGGLQIIAYISRSSIILARMNQGLSVYLITL